MNKIKVFISSVQKELAEEREALYEHFTTNPFLHPHFRPILFERLSASGKAPDQVYFKEVGEADIYLGLIGTSYGYEDEEGISPTEREYDHATTQGKERWIFIKGDSSVLRHEKVVALIDKIGLDISRKRYEDIEDLKTAVSEACATYLRDKNILSSTPFDSAFHPDATLQDINDFSIQSFVKKARSKRGFPLDVGSSNEEVLAHLKMYRDGMVTNSGLLVFGKDVQRFFPSAIVKCAHFHGKIVEKPIRDHKVIGGDVFHQTDVAVDFVLSKIDVSVGTRDQGTQAPVSYEIPRAIITEAIVNAIAHRDYRSNGSIHVHVFADRIEVSNPGRLTPELSLSQLREQHGSYPTNLLLAECMYQLAYIERFGTGTVDIIRLSEDAGLKAPEFNTDEGFKIILWRSEEIVIRGYRIELDEIKSVLRSYEGILSEIVMVRQVADGKTELIAYVIGDKNLDIDRLQMYLEDKLPSYMIPKHYIIMEDFPLLLDGRLDRGALPSPSDQSLVKRTVFNPYFEFDADDRPLEDPQGSGVSVGDDGRPIKGDYDISNKIDKEPPSGPQPPHNHPTTTPQPPPHHPLSPEIRVIILATQGDMKRSELLEAAGLKDRKNFNKNYLHPAIKKGLIEMAYPDNPNHPRQRYRLTEEGLNIKKTLTDL